MTSTRRGGYWLKGVCHQNSQNIDFTASTIHYHYQRSLVIHSLITIKKYCNYIKQNDRSFRVKTGSRNRGNAPGENPGLSLTCLHFRLKFGILSSLRLNLTFGMILKQLNKPFKNSTISRPILSSIITGTLS